MPELNKIADPQSRRFVERLSCILVVFSAIGAMLVLLDPVIKNVPIGATATISIGGNGFSDQLKGAVVSLILVSGFAAVVAYWLGASNQGDKAQESVNNIAAAAAPAQAAAVAAATGTGNGVTTTARTDQMNVDAANVTIERKDP